MIHLMLNTDRIETGRFDIDRFAVTIQRLHSHHSRTRHLAAQPVDTQTAFPILLLLRTLEYDLGIDEHSIGETVLTITLTTQHH